MQTEFITLLITQLGFQLPHLIVWGAGVGLSIYSYPRNPKKFLLMATAFSMLFLIALASPIFFTWNTMQAFNSDVAASQVGLRSLVFTLVTTPIWVGTWIILLIAIFNPKYNSPETTLPG